VAREDEEMKPDITVTAITFTADMTLVDRVISTWALVALDQEKEWPRVRNISKNRLMLVWIEGQHERTRRIRLADALAAQEKLLLYEFIIGMTRAQHGGREVVLRKLGLDPEQISPKLHQQPYAKSGADA
jgi:hypothetical protein